MLRVTYELQSRLEMTVAPENLEKTPSWNHPVKTLLTHKNCEIYLCIGNLLVLFVYF